MKKLYSFLLTIAALIATAQVPNLNLVLVKQGFNRPLDIKHCGDDRLFVVEQGGLIRIMLKDGTILPTPFLTLDSVNSNGNEQGLLGLAFSPNYKQDGYIYVNYIFGSGAGNTRISRFQVSPSDSNLVPANTEKVLLTFTQPFTNHNGGNMMFGPDGYLYISQGDGGSANDPQNNGQRLDTYHGKMLRINVTGQTTYTIPADNPFVGQPNVKEEIWSYGLRNPWRCSFDRLTGDMWLGDVGQAAFEEIDFQDASSSGGENYGWRCREGFIATPGINPSGCPTTGFTEPAVVYARNTPFCSVTGGYVYRGAQYSKLFGKYLYTDFCAGVIYTVSKSGLVFDIDTPTGYTVYTNGFSAFGEDNSGELYMTYRGNTSTNGRIYRIVETSDCKPVAFITFNDTIEGCYPQQLTALKGDTLSYEWYNSSGPINGANAHVFTPQQAGWYKVKVAKQQAGCESFSDSVYVLLKDTTALQAAAGQKFCVQDTAVSIANLVQPGGGLYQSPLVTGDVFNPSAAGAGTVQLPYVFTNNSNCISAAVALVEVGQPTTLTKNVPVAEYCQYDAPFSLQGYVTPAGGTYSGVAVSNDTFTPANATLSNGRVYYTYQNAFGCESVDSFDIQVLECVGVLNTAANASWQVYPNPASESIYVHTSGIKNVTAVRLLAPDGRMLYEVDGPAPAVIQLSLRTLSPGIYLVLLQTDSFVSVKKVVKE